MCGRFSNPQITQMAGARLRRKRCGVPGRMRDRFSNPQITQMAQTSGVKMLHGWRGRSRLWGGGLTKTIVTYILAYEQRGQNDMGK
jgi:hypothetical protein